MENMNKVLESMTFEFFGTAQHKIQAAKQLGDKDAVFLDVRAEEEYKTMKFDLEHHQRSLHIPIDQIPARLAEIPKDKNVAVFCASGNRSVMVYFYLKALGYENVRVFEGGYPELVAELKPGKILKTIKASK